MSAQDTPEMSATQAQQLDEEAAALAADIVPYFTSVAPVEAIWSSERIDFLAERRTAVFGHKLFFDELLSFASVDTALYPPRSANQLEALLKAIFAATTLDYLKQLSLVYYLLLDLDAYTERDNGADADPVADRFADTYVVLPQFTDAMQGYWLLDNDHYEDAVPLLAVADFIPKIVRTLFLGSSSSRSDVARAKLLLRFLRTSNQTTSSPPGSEAFLQEIEMQIQALFFVSGPSRAFAEIRAITSTILDDEPQRVAVRARLIFKVLEHCFAPPRSAAIKNLLACSLDPEEEVTLESFVLSPPAAMTATWSYVAADVLIIRYISQGRYMDAVGLDRRLGPDVSQGHSSAKDAQQRSKMMEQRKRMIVGAREILPEVQKELLRIEESVEISGCATQHQEVKDREALAINGANGKNAISDFADRSGLGATPLSASPATRRSNTQTPTTQAAILSAVVCASASPSPFSTPSKPSAASASNSPAHGTPQHPSAMIGFLAKHAVANRATPDSNSDVAKSNNDAAADGDDAMQDELTEMDGSAVLVARPSEAQPAPASPWRNQPSLTSSSPFSGLPKLTRPAVAGGASPFRSSPSRFQPASTSPFAASSSLRSSPSLSSITATGGARSKLPGALGIVAQQGRRSRLARDEIEVDESDADADAATYDGDEGEGEDYGDDTFVQSSHHTNSKGKGKGKGKGESDVSIGRLVPGRRGWKESQDHADDDELELQEQERDMPPTKRRTRKTAAASTAGKITRSRTGVDLDSEAGGAKMSKSRTDANLAGKRTTRSTSAANRKPLTLSNLEQHQRDGNGEGEGEVPIARRTRAATAEQESVNGRGVEGSTIYTISEVGDADGADGVGARKSPSKRGGGAGRKTPAKSSGAAVRRSNRLTSVEPEAPPASPAKRRGGGTRRTLGSTKMPGSLE